MNREKKPSDAMLKTKEVFNKIGHVLGIIGKVLYHLRKLFLAAPVVYAAMRIYAYAEEKLPETVGILLLESGDFQYMLARNTAVLGCMGVTGACLLLMFCSRRTIYHWVISIFSLVLPFLLIITNMYTA